MLAILPAVIIATAVFGRRLRSLSTAFQDEVAAANANAEEALVGIRIVQSFTAERFEAARYGAAIDTAFGSAIRRARVRAFFIPTVILAMFSGIGVVLWYGGQQALAGTLAPGTLITFLLLTVIVAGSIGTLHRPLQPDPGGAGRLEAHLRAARHRQRPPRTRPSRACGATCAARCASRACASATATAATTGCSTASTSTPARARSWPWWARPGPARRRS
jgi:ABC-type multidrug transport system fused ATPase/permease subunit